MASKENQLTREDEQVLDDLHKQSFQPSFEISVRDPAVQAEISGIKTVMKDLKGAND